jgi:hypothetical protein
LGELFRKPYVSRTAAEWAAFTKEKAPDLFEEVGGLSAFKGEGYLWPDEIVRAVRKAHAADSASPTRGPSEPSQGKGPAGKAAGDRQQGLVLDRIYQTAERAKPSFDAKVREIADALGVTAVIPDTLKGRARALEKINSDYNGDASKIKDVLRATISADSAAAAQQVLDEIQRVFDIHQVKSTLGAGAVTIDGYRDAKAFVKVGSIIAEIQVHVAPMEHARNLAHGLYEQRQGIERGMLGRAPTADEKARIADLNARMWDIYAPAWERAASSRATISRNSASGTITPFRYTESAGKDRLSGSNAKYPNSGDSMRATGTSSTSKNSVPAGNLSGSMANSFGIGEDDYATPQRPDMQRVQQLNRALKPIASSKAQQAADAEAQFWDNAARGPRGAGAALNIPLTPMPAVLRMLGAPNQMVTMATSVFDKVNDWKHKADVRAAALTPAKLNDLLRKPALVFKTPEGEFEMVLTAWGAEGPLTAVILPDAVTDGVRHAAVKSIYSRPPENVTLRVVEGSSGRKDARRTLVYADVSRLLAAFSPSLAKGSAPSGTNLSGTAQGAAQRTLPIEVRHAISGAAAKRKSKPGGGYTGLQTENDLLRYIGDNYTGDPADTPAASPTRRHKPQLFQGGFDIPEDSKLSAIWRTLVFKAQDLFDSVNVAQKTAEKISGGPLPEDQDTYMMETVYRGRVGALVEDFNAEHVKPILDIMSKNNLEILDVDSYLQARHVQLDKVNAYLASINPDLAAKGVDTSALSGMTDAEAAAIMDKETPALKEIGRRVDEITKMRRELLVSSGLETQSTIDAWEKTYKHYVPLHRDDGDGSMPSKGRGFDVRGKEKRRAGSNKAVTNVLAHVIAQHEATIIRAEKAEVARTLLNFVENHPNPNLWEVNPVDYAPRFDADGLVTYAPNPSYKLADNVLAVRVAGQDYHVSFNTKDTHAARIVFAIKNLGAQDSGILVNQLNKLNRWLSMVNTSMSPEFTVTNFLRDLQTAGYNLSNTEIDKLKWSILGDIGKAMRGIQSAELGNGSHPWAKHYQEFRTAGGKTGWLQAYENIDARRTDLERQLNAMRPGVGRSVARGLRAVVDFVEAENTVIENAIRLSAFVHARKAGLSPSKAGALAKELTVNFNRKGEYGPILNALYLFYNASIQGSARIFSALASSQKARILVGATVAFASALELMNRAVGDDDDDGVPYYDKIPDYVKDRNMIIMLPNSKGKYLKVALPWGYNIFHVMGQELASAAMKKGYDPGKSAMRVVSSILDAWNPISAGGSAIQWVMPTFLDPLAMVVENKAWTGRPLMPEDKFAEYPTPDAYKFWPGAREGSKWVAAQLNEITGGNRYEKGAIDISPETIDLFIDTATGGMGRFLADSVSTPWKAATEGPDAVEARTVPFLRKVYGEPESNRARLQFFERRQELKMIADQLKAAANDPVALDRLEAKYKGKVGLIEDGVLEHTESQLRALRREKKMLEGEGNDPATRAEIKAIDAMMQSVQMDFNRAYNEAVQ